MVLKYLIQKEFKQFLRNPFMPKLMVMFPIVLMLVFPWAATQNVEDVRLVFVDHDHSAESRRLIEKTTASGFFLAGDYTDSYSEAAHLVQCGKADIIVEIPVNFGRNLISTSDDATLMLSANAVNGTKGQFGSAYLVQIINDYSSDIVIAQQPLATQGATMAATPNISTRFLFNPTLDYKRFMIPAMMTMLLTLLSGFLPALNIVSEKEKGTIEQMNVSPVTRVQFILGKLIPYWIMGFLVMNFALLLAWITYGFAPATSMLNIYAFVIVFIALVSGFGLVISNYSDTMQQAMFVMFFFLLIFMLMSGLFTPVTSMPQWAQYIAAFNPLKYFVESMRMMFLKGSTVTQLLPKYAILLTFALTFNIWAIISYKKSK